MNTNQPTEPHSIAIVDNDALVLRLLRPFFEKDGAFNVLWTETDGRATLERFHRSVSGMRQLPELMLVDISMKGISGIDLCEALRYENDRMMLLGITSYEPSAYFAEAARAGMQGVMAKEQVDSIIDAMNSLLNGASSIDDSRFDSPKAAFQRLHAQGARPFVTLLSDKEREIITLSTRGFSSAQIAQSLDMSDSTVKTHISRIVRKFNVANKREAIALWARKVGL